MKKPRSQAAGKDINQVQVIVMHLAHSPHQNSSPLQKVQLHPTQKLIAAVEFHQVTKGVDMGLLGLWHRLRVVQPAIVQMMIFNLYCKAICYMRATSGIEVVKHRPYCLPPPQLQTQLHIVLIVYLQIPPQVAPQVHLYLQRREYQGLLSGSATLLMTQLTPHLARFRAVVHVLAGWAVLVHWLVHPTINALRHDLVEIPAEGDPVLLKQRRSVLSVTIKHQLHIFDVGLLTFVQFEFHPLLAPPNHRLALCRLLSVGDQAKHGQVGTVNLEGSERVL